MPRRLLECDEGAIGIFLPESSSTARRLSLPLQPAATIDNSPLPSAAVPTPLLEIEITKESLRKVERALQEQVCQGHSRRFPSILTFTHISAKEALELSGVTAMPNRVVQYIHFLPHSVLGSDSQCITNIGIGTRQANAAMELINGMIRKLLFRKKGAPASLSLSAAPQWVPGFEKIRLLESLTYTLKYQDRFVSIKFDMLTLLPISRAEIQTVEKILWEKFTITTAPTLSPTSSR